MTVKRARKPYHHGDLREGLVEAGTALIEEAGLDAFTLRECARRAGVSHAAPKNHFATAEDLLAEIAARGFDRFVAALDEAADAEPVQSPDVRLIAMGRAYVGFARANPGVYGLMFRSTRDVPKSEHLKASSTAAWMQLVREVTQVIGPSRSDAAARSFHVWGLVHGIASLIIDRRLPQPVDVDDMIVQCLASLPGAIRGVGAS